MVEVAYYRDTDSVFAFTHFARKDNRMYAMAHPHSGVSRMYMFELDEDLWSSIDEPRLRPDEFEFRSYPNPFNSSVTIAIEGVGAGFTPARVEIFDLNGRRVAEIIPPVPPLTRGEEERKSPLSKGDLGGLVWHPDPSLPSGVYLVRAKFGGGRGALAPIATKRVVYLK